MFDQGPTPEVPALPPTHKFKIVTKLGMHYDVLYAGDMAGLAAHLKVMGHFMNPQLWVPLDQISHLIDLTVAEGAPAGAGDNVVSMFAAGMAEAAKGEATDE